ncbi:MAG: hypothetical protein PeribacterA2_0984 [Candidatus Peribacter riflensis]|uniref:Uncharacterized protein n=1 Tax=Candidatus Peribacter riflensis TaxID=1735162 RepID=A0A0S1SLS6_9BACT|nr:MAG: hypothetical protein PeribacterA2_0984 [Candidatus Peribacter riflensis]ALM11446.1 MAG: hypothetical protein PeribacterB2_0986 [Candidatus Peribacter riflensis]ALM12548.1 MAG: hypothetical protein PeribacterC2_0985 [Candidatus Peribacter riflensis]ALM13649.1 MAG: hypothetical protein PeribacterD1_0984 [Candidatus Peribacter riflensis]ALM14752.1 MAG: hypothetical protein PeribacterD2_0986 [Candidatus Peribacter riflensis]
MEVITCEFCDETICKECSGCGCDENACTCDLTPKDADEE